MTEQEQIELVRDMSELIVQTILEKYPEQNEPNVMVIACINSCIRFMKAGGVPDNKTAIDKMIVGLKKMRDVEGI